MHKIKVLTCLLLTVLLTGCAVSEPIPELIEPVSQTSAYRPVQYGDTTNFATYAAEVVAEEYPVFLEDNVVISEFLCDIGDTVKQGQKLALVDNTNLEEQLEDLTIELNYLIKIRDLENKIQEFNITHNRYRSEDSLDEIENLKNQLSKANYAQDHAGKNSDGTDYTGLSSDEISAQIELYEEIHDTAEYLKSLTSINQEYDNRDHNAQVDSLKKRISDIQSKIDKTVITAPCDGVITSISSMDNFGKFSAYDNLLVISNPDKLHVELTMGLNDAEYKAFKNAKYTKATISVDGTQYNLIEKTYTNEEKIAMEKRYVYPNARFEFADVAPAIKPGQKLMIRFERESKGNVLCLSTDCIVTVGNSNFVYVKTEGGREKREIITGSSANGFVEIVDGLQEGELVYYTQNAVIPTDYDSYTVSKGTFTQTNHEYMAHPYFVYTRKRNVSYDHEATVTKIYVKRDDVVKKGDIICTLSTKVGTARLVEIQTRLKRLQENIFWNNYENEKIEDENPYDPVPGYQREIVKLRYAQQLENLNHQLERAKKINDGSGIINIYAPCDGVIGRMNVEVNTSIKEGKEVQICTINDASSKKIGLATGDYHAGLGNEVQFTVNKETISVNAVGESGRDGTGYLSTKDGKIYSTKGFSSKETYVDANTVLPGGLSFDNVSMSNVDVSFTVASATDALLVPSGAINKETKSYSSNLVNYYVWLITDDGLVKQPVSLYEYPDQNGLMMVLSGLNSGDKVAIKKAK